MLAVDKAYKLLLDQEQKKRALDVIQAGKEYVEHTVSIPWERPGGGEWWSVTGNLLFATSTVGLGHEEVS